VYDGAGPGRILIGFTPAPDDKELAHRLYGIVNVGPPLRL